MAVPIYYESVLKRLRKAFKFYFKATAVVLNNI